MFAFSAQTPQKAVCLRKSGIAKAVPLFVFFISFFQSSSVAASPDWGALARDPKWMSLLHWSGSESQADGPEFFLAPEGKSSLQAEFEADLKGFMQKPASTLEVDLNSHALCRFPARARWLRKVLPDEAAQFPRVACPDFEKFRSSLSAIGVSVMFSSYHLNNPSSAFGHTFLRLKHAGRGKAELLDYGINYEATVTTQNAVLYALGGVLGWFRGSFTKLPFYYKVREYSDFESRDLWTYELALTPPQVEELVEHLWEVGHTYFDYYYFTENCSYHLLMALDAVQPEWGFRARVPKVIIPSETMRVLQQTPRLVSKVEYRPSNRALFEARYSALSDSDRDEFERLIAPREGTTPSSPWGRAALDAGIEYYDYRYAKELMDPQSQASKTKQEWLITRSELGGVSSPPDVSIPWQKQPHLGHARQRFAWGVARDFRSKTQFELSYRGAFHDFLDPVDGYPDDAEMQLLGATLRFPANRPLPKLQSLRLVEIASYPSIRPKQFPLAWKIDTVLKRLEERHCSQCLGGQLALYGGAAYNFSQHSTQSVYFLAGSDLTFAPGFYQAKFRLGMGPLVGYRARFGKRLFAQVESSGKWYPGFDPAFAWEEGFEVRWISSDRFSWGLSQSRYSTRSEVGAKAYFYF